MIRSMSCDETAVVLYGGTVVLRSSTNGIPTQNIFCLFQKHYYLSSMTPKNVNPYKSSNKPKINQTSKHPSNHITHEIQACFCVPTDTSLSLFLQKMVYSLYTTLCTSCCCSPFLSHGCVLPRCVLKMERIAIRPLGGRASRSCVWWC